MRNSTWCTYALLVIFLVQSCSEEEIPQSQVPQPVIAAFQKKYPGATDMEWEKEKENGKIIYEVEMKINGKEIEAEFDEDGTFLKEEEE